MKTSKKVVAILAILAIVCVSAFAVETETTVKKSNWSINAGTSYGVSHIGASYNLGRWEFGGNLYSGFPNILILSYLNTTEENRPDFLDALKLSFSLAYAGNVSALYDVTKGDKFDVDLGFALSGLYTELFKESGLKGGIISLDLAARFKYNLNRQSGIYVATELPLAGIVLTNQKDSESGETTKEVVPFAVLTPEFFSASLALLLYTTRIGYVYNF